MIKCISICFSVWVACAQLVLMLPFLPLCLRPGVTCAPPPPPGAIVIDLVSEDEEDALSAPVHPAAAPAPPPPLLPPDPTRRDGMFIAPSRVLVEAGPSAGSLLGEPGLFTSVPIPAGAFVAFYTGAFFTRDEFTELPEAEHQALSRYAVEDEKHDVLVSPIADAGPNLSNVNFTLHAAAAVNEPGESEDANVFAQASVVEAIVGDEDEIHTFVVFCLFTCSRIDAGKELLWNYGDGYRSMRELVGYKVGKPCADEVVDGLRLPSPRRLVEAILRDGRRVNDALYELALSGSDSSGEEWEPAKRRRR